MVSQRDVLQVQLFGGFTLSHDGEQLPPLASRHARLLFAWLVLQRGRPQPRTLLCDRLWPDLPESRARRRLSHALWQVQDAFNEGGQDRPYLLTPGDQVKFDAGAPYWLDVEEFEQRLDEVARADEAAGAELRHLRRCVELYQGDLLAGSYEDWVLREQDRLRERHVQALAWLVEVCKQRANFDEALAVARRWTHQAPLHEEAHREVMRLAMLLGQPGQAVEQFERCRSVLAEELSTDPSPATIALHESIVQRGTTDTPRHDPVDELASDRLVGRDDERVALVDQLERTLAGTAATVFVEGEPGVGKTQLLAQAAEDARWRGFSVLWGVCTGPDVPFGALREALLPELDVVRVAQLRTLVAPVWRHEASRVLPPLRPDDAPSVPPMRGADAADRMRQALAEVLVGLAAIDPVVLVLEDVHLADPETLAVLQTVARHGDRGRLLLLLSFRDVDARQAETVWEGLRDLDRDARPTRLHLGPLTPFETGRLLREVLGTAQLPAAFVEAVHRECGGNPLYVLELLRSLRDTGSLAGGTDHLDTIAVPVTSDLRTVIRSRIDLLGWEAGAVAEFAAVLDDEVDLPTLEAAMALGPRQVSTALAELARRNLLVPDETTWRFTHAATRRVLLDGLGPERTRQLHLAAADALEETRPDAVEALALHLRAAGAGPRALPYLRRAAARALDVHAYDTAAHHLDAAVAILDEAPVDVDVRIELLLEAEAVRDVLGRREAQADALDQLEALCAGDPALATEVAVRRASQLALTDQFEAALAIARGAAASATDEELRGRALLSVGEVLHWLGRHEEAIETLQPAVSALEGTAHTGHARYALASVLRARQRYHEARDILEAARAEAEQDEDELALVRALGGLADVASETGDMDAAVAAYDRSVALARSVGYRHREGVSLVNLATHRVERAEPAAALAAFDEAEQVFRSLGNRRGLAYVRVNRGWLLHRWLGRDDRAGQDATAALEYSNEVGSAALSAATLETLAGIDRRRGEHETARTHLAAGVETATAAGDDRALVQLRRGEAELAMDAGALLEAGRIAGDAAVRAQDLDMRGFAAELAALAADAWSAAGATGRAIRAATLARTHLAAASEPHRLHHRLAQVAERTGDTGLARDHHQRAFAALEASLRGLDEPGRSAARQVPTHAAIMEAGSAHAPRSVDLRMARVVAPRGRALGGDDTVLVDVELGPPPRTPEERRAAVLGVLEQVEDQHAVATVQDLALLFDVSPSTVRRDLRTLRAQGHDVATRGSGTAG